MHQLQVFEATARHCNFTRAAEELFLTQPTVSMQVKQLSKSVGMPLFEKVGKRLYMTDAGQAVFETCQAVFDRLAQLESSLLDLQGMDSGKLRIGATTTAQYIVPKLLAPFCHTYPGVDIFLEIDKHKNILERLNDNEDDLYILSQLPERSDIQARSFLCNPLAVVAPAAHPLAKQSNISLETLVKEPLILRERGSATREAIETLFAERELVPQVRLELDNNEAIKQSIAEGLGLSVLSLHSLSRVSSAPELVTLDVEGFPIHHQWYAVFLKDKALPIAAQTFLDYLLRESHQHCQVYTHPALERLESLAG
ncbi:LysR substrate-binding domain-containing protein [Egbenema bharatensis]|uniref:LysR substrate-binding domain-containing protein n=1 Tax=Egbenema bharatensis TaxID=3463334 RepID=UPI003A848D81